MNPTGYESAGYESAGYECAVARIFLDSENLLSVSRYASGISTYVVWFFSTWISVLKTDVSFRPTARLNERESLKFECKRRIVVLLCSPEHDGELRKIITSYLG